MADNSSTSNSSFKALALRAAILAVLVVCIDQGLGRVLGELHARTREGDFGGCVNLTLEQRNDVVVLGSSRAKHHYIPDVLEKVTGSSFFNAGIDAQNILSHYGIAQLILDEYTPKAFIIDLNIEQFQESDRRAYLDKLSILLPYYERGNAALNAWILQRSKFERLKLLSGTYPYNSMLLPLLKYTLRPDSAGTIKNRGYLPYYGSNVLDIVSIEGEDVPEYSSVVPEVNPLYTSVLRDFVMLARKKNVNVIVCMGPLWEDEAQDLAGRNALIDAYVLLLKELEVPFIRIDSGTDPAFKNSEIFKDRIHLNNKGATLFSTLLGERLREYVSAPEPESGTVVAR